MKMFKELERAGWSSKAANYDGLVGAITIQAMDAILDEAQLASGTRLLDVACGPGYGAGFAAGRGAHAIGLDLAPNMVTEAASRFPQAEFREGDAEKLPFPDGVFERVICAFGLLHFADPDQAIAEAYRVLAPDGRLVFTIWAGPAHHAFFSLVTSAIQAHGNPDIDLPLGPSRFRFSNESECCRTLAGAGFADMSMATLNLDWHASRSQDFLDLIYKCTVRTAMLLENQEAAARENIHQAILDGAAQFKRGDHYICMWPALMVSATKPAS